VIIQSHYSRYKSQIDDTVDSYSKQGSCGREGQQIQIGTDKRESSCGCHDAERDLRTVEQRPLNRDLASKLPDVDVTGECNNAGGDGTKDESSGQKDWHVHSQRLTRR
jgi:hypothetical protein